MRALSHLMLGLCLLAGCGDAISDRVVNSPEVQQRLLENEKRRQAEREREQKQLDEIRSSSEAALRLAEELPQKSAPTKATQPAADADGKSSSPPVPSKIVADRAAPVEAAQSRPAAAVVKSPTAVAAANPAGWAQLRAGLSPSAVKDLLGPPTTTSEDRTLLYWHYGSGAGSGRVAFLAGSGQLLAWESPIH